MPLTVDNLGSPIIVTGTTEADTEILSDNGIVHIRTIYWYNPVSSAHLCNVTDGNGRVILPMYAAANVSQYFDINYSYFGIRCDNLDSGTLYIYITQAIEQVPNAISLLIETKS